MEMINQAPSSGMTERFESNCSLDPAQIQEWVERFKREGFLFLEDVLTQVHVDLLKADLDWSLGHFTSLDEDPNGKLLGQKSESSIQLCHRMFEHSPANLNLFDLEPIVSLAEALVAPNCHVIHNNSFISPPEEDRSVAGDAGRECSPSGRPEDDAR